MFNKLFQVTGLFPPKSGSAYSLVFLVPNRYCSQEIRPITNPDVALLKRGTGGRSSFNGQVVTVFGATGYFGSHICTELGKRGSQLIIPYRSEPDDLSVKNLKLVGDLGQVLFQPFDLRDPVSIRKAIKYSNVVINLIGKSIDTSNFDLHAVNIKGAREIAKACKELNVERLIHFSTLNVSEKHQSLYLKNFKYYSTKLLGEEAVLSEFPTATIFRPSSIYGPFDHFLWPLVCKRRCIMGTIPLYANGKKTIKQPVFVKDVALGVLNAINDYSTRGKIYQAVGPTRYYLHDIAVYCAQVLQRHLENSELTTDIKYSYIFKLMLKYYKIRESFYIDSKYNLSEQTIEMEATTDVVHPKLLTLEDLGVPLSEFEDKVPSIILPVFQRPFLFDSTYDDYAAVDSLKLKQIGRFDF